MSLSAAAEVLRPAKKILVFTGAGISTESGIPDFRGPEGLWTKVDPADFTIQRYLTNREIRVSNWRMHQSGQLWGARSTVTPNPAHHAVVDLWRHGRISGCVTQNIDGLHVAAGLPEEKVAEVHGNGRKVHCLDCDAIWPTEEVLGWVDAGDEDPHCPECGGMIKTTIVMFGEYLPDSQMGRAGLFASMADAVLVVGSTMGVYPAADIPLSAVRGGAPMVILNLGATDQDHSATVKIDGMAGEVLPLLVDAIT